MNWKPVLKSAGAETLITLFATAIAVALLMFGGGNWFKITEISIPFVFFGVNLLFFTVWNSAAHKKAARILQICVNILLTAVYAVLMVKL